MSRSCQRATFCEAADALTLLRVALVRHRGGASLALGEGLLDLQDFRPLKVAQLCCEAVEGGGDDGECRDEVGVAVAVDDLR
jgi:hypothetical protein